MQFIEELFNILIFPLMAVLSVFIISYIRVKKDELIKKYNDETLTKYLNMVEDTIGTCVLATNQTYVDTLKKQGKFDAEAQKIAFQKTYNAVLAILAEDAKEYLAAAVGDLETYLVGKIEASVNMYK